MFTVAKRLYVYPLLRGTASGFASDFFWPLCINLAEKGHFASPVQAEPAVKGNNTGLPHLQVDPAQQQQQRKKQSARPVVDLTLLTIASTSFSAPAWTAAPANFTLAESGFALSPDDSAPADMAA